jgi:hypothetical protein
VAGSPYPIVPSAPTATGLSNYSTNYIDGFLTIVAATPTVNAPTAASISSSIATLGGAVTTDGESTLSKRGVLYAPARLDPNPALGDGIAIEKDLTCSDSYSLMSAP